MKPESVFSMSSLQGFLTLVIVCGIALLFSIHPGARVESLHASRWIIPPSSFHVVYVLMLGLLGVSRGALIAANLPARIFRPKLYAQMAQHILVAQLLMLPFLVFSRSVFPDRSGSLLLLFVYATLISFLFCLISYRLDLRSMQRRRSAFLLRYGVYFACVLIPFGLGVSTRALSAFVSLSPIGVAQQIVGELSALPLAVAFVFPVVATLLLLIRSRPVLRRGHEV